MSIFPSFRQRSNAPEWMDDLSRPASEINRALQDIQKVNHWLGGHSVSIRGLKPYLQARGAEPVQILDMGCGDGAFLRHLHRYCSRKGIPVQLTGWDRNPGGLGPGGRHKNPEDLHFECRDILSFPALPQGEVIIVCNLFLHHFTDVQILKIIRNWRDMGCRAVIVNDLNRNPLAYYLFHVFGFIFRLSRMARHDGRISILRGFTRKDLKEFNRELGVKGRIRWKWAFRYLWVLDFKAHS